MRDKRLAEALRALPIKRLVTGNLVKGEDAVCALGACLTPEEREQYLLDEEEYMDFIYLNKTDMDSEELIPHIDYEDKYYALVSNRHDTSNEDVWRVNDGLLNSTPEERYEQVLKWAEGSDKEEPEFCMERIDVDLKS